MKRFVWLPYLLILVALSACGRHPARSGQSFDEIRKLVSGKTAAEVTALLGKPDSRQKILIDDERWIWWNYTVLDGDEYPPDMRGKIVHLEITFTRPQEPVPGSGREVWRVSSPFGVSYSFAGKT